MCGDARWWNAKATVPGTGSRSSKRASQQDRWSEAGGDETTDGNETAGPGALGRFVVSDGSDSRALAFLAGCRGSASSSSLAFVSIGRRWRIGIGGSEEYACGGGRLDRHDVVPPRHALSRDERTDRKAAASSGACWVGGDKDSRPTGMDGKAGARKPARPAAGSGDPSSEHNATKIQTHAHVATTTTCRSTRSARSERRFWQQQQQQRKDTDVTLAAALIKT